MAYTRKTKDRVRFKGAWLVRHRTALLAAGMRERELDIVQWHDGDNLTFQAIADKFGFTSAWAQQIYHRAIRKFQHSARRKFLPKSLQ